MKVKTSYKNGKIHNTYIAPDGREFTEEEDCKNYENTFLMEKYNSSKNIIFFDKNGKRLPINNDTMIEVYFLYLDNMGYDEVLLSWLDEWDVPQEDGMYFYNEYRDEFEEVSCIIDEYQRFFDLFKKVKKSIKNALR